jgi:hypothetical protein
MAFAFSQINKLLEDEGKPQQSNIFAADQGGQDPSQGGEGANLGQGQGVKTSTEGDMAGGGGGSGTAAENVPMEMKKQDARVLKRNVGKVDTPDFTKSMQSQLSEADKSLQSEADKYIEGAGKQASTYTVDDKTLDSAVGGDQAAQDAARKALSAEMVDYEDFTPQTQYQFDNVANLDSSAGLDQLLKGESRGKLSAREIAFDRGILERSPEFIKIREALKGQQSSLIDKAGQMSTGKTEEAQKLIDTAIGNAKTGVETGLSNREKQLLKENEAEAAGINKARTEMQKAGIPKEVQDQVIAIKKGLAGTYEDSLRMDQMLMNAGIDPSKFMTWNTNVTAQDVIDEKEASKFNNILSLLGKGGDAYIAGKGAGDAFSFDKNKASDAIVATAQQDRKNTDTKLNTEMADLIKAIEGRVGTQNESRKVRYSQQQQALLNRIRNELGGDFNKLNLEQVNAMFSGPNEYGFDNVMSAKEADRLNAILGELGSKNKRYKVSDLGDFSMPGYDDVMSVVNGQLAAIRAAESQKNRWNDIQNGNTKPWVDQMQQDANPYVNPDNTSNWVSDQLVGARENLNNEIEEAAIKINPFKKKNKGPKW